MHARGDTREQGSEGGSLERLLASPLRLPMAGAVQVDDGESDGHARHLRGEHRADDGHRAERGDIHASTTDTPVHDSAPSESASTLTISSCTATDTTAATSTSSSTITADTATAIITDTSAHIATGTTTTTTEVNDSALPRTPPTLSSHHTSIRVESDSPSSPPTSLGSVSHHGPTTLPSPLWVEDTSETTPAWVDTSRFLPLGVVLRAMFVQTAECMWSPSFELRRIAGMVLPLLSEVMYWFDPLALEDIWKQASELGDSRAGSGLSTACTTSMLCSLQVRRHDRRVAVASAGGGRSRW
jgi:hypothetical protein